MSPAIWQSVDYIPLPCLCICACVRRVRLVRWISHLFINYKGKGIDILAVGK